MRRYYWIITLVIWAATFGAFAWMKQMKETAENLRAEWGALQEWRDTLVFIKDIQGKKILDESMERRIDWQEVQKKIKDPKSFFSEELKKLNLESQAFVEKADAKRVWGAWSLIEGTHKIQPEVLRKISLSSSEVSIELEGDWTSLKEWVLYFGRVAWPLRMESFRAVQEPAQKIAITITF